MSICDDVGMRTEVRAVKAGSVMAVIDLLVCVGLCRLEAQTLPSVGMNRSRLSMLDRTTQQSTFSDIHGMGVK